MDNQQMAALREVAAKLRELKLNLEKIGSEIDERQTLLPERHWRKQIDDDISGVGILIDAASMSMDEALTSLAEITGEDEPEAEGTAKAAPLPEIRPTHGEADERRREEAARIRRQR